MISIVNTNLFLVVLILAIVYRIIIQVINKKLRIDTERDTIKKILEKSMAGNDISEEDMKKVREIQLKFMKMQLAYILIFIVVSTILIKVLPQIEVIKFSFTLPRINRDWIGPFGSFIFTLLIINIVEVVVRKIKGIKK